MQNINLKGLSAHQLESLAARATALAKDLRAHQPSTALALEAGVEDISYRTVRYGLVPSYRGEAEITMEDGSRWKAVGRRPRGNAEVVTKDGFIEFTKLD